MTTQQREWLIRNREKIEAALREVGERAAAYRDKTDMTVERVLEIVVEWLSTRQQRQTLDEKRAYYEYDEALNHLTGMRGRMAAYVADVAERPRRHAANSMGWMLDQCAIVAWRHVREVPITEATECTSLD